MHQFQVKIANHTIGVESLYIRSYVISRDFITKDLPEFIIQMDQSDIDAVRLQYENQHGECCLGDTTLETIALQKKVSEKLIDLGVFLIHGAAISFKDSAIIFSGRSGVGKTTHIMKWVRQLPDSYIVNGDKPFISVEQNPIVFASPWAGKENLYTNTSVSLKHVVFLERCEKNYIESIPFSRAFPFLLQRVYCPQDIGKMKKTLYMIQELQSHVSFWLFHCNNFKEDCFDIAFNALIENDSVL